MTIPTRPRFAPGRTPLWRDDRSLQFGLDPRHAVVLDGLSPSLADVVRRVDGRRRAEDLTGAQSGAGRLLRRLAAAGVLESGEDAEPPPPVLAADAATWGLRTGHGVTAMVARRAAATVEVYGSGRIAVAVAALLAAAGVGAVVVLATGTLTGADTGTGHLPRDLGRGRRASAEAAVRRVRTAPELVPAEPDVAVLADDAVWDPGLALRLVNERVPHLAVHAREASVVVGPLVLPGRTSCLRCADLHRSDLDPCWPRIAAQLAGRPPGAALAAAQIAAGLAAEQVLALLSGPGETPDEPPATATTAELDPLHGTVLRRRWPAHPRCSCGA